MPRARSNAITEDDYIYQQAHQYAMDYVESKRGARGDLYASWTQHVGSCSNVCAAFNRRLTELGVSDGHRGRQYLAQFMAEHDIGDNYYE